MYVPLKILRHCSCILAPGIPQGSKSLPWDSEPLYHTLSMWPRDGRQFLMSVGDFPECSLELFERLFPLDFNVIVKVCPTFLGEDFASF